MATGERGIQAMRCGSVWGVDSTAKVSQGAAQGVLGRHLLARGYFVATRGSITDDVTSEHIESQDAEPEDDDGVKVTE